MNHGLKENVHKKIAIDHIAKFALRIIGNAERAALPSTLSHS